MRHLGLSLYAPVPCAVQAPRSDESTTYSAPLPDPYTAKKRVQARNRATRSSAFVSRQSCFTHRSQCHAPRSNLRHCVMPASGLGAPLSRIRVRARNRHIIAHTAICPAHILAHRSCRTATASSLEAYALPSHNTEACPARRLPSPHTARPHPPVSA
ncbi:hypothetical protein A0H81_07327 [Grifola frondosa]|uniref:Uncharacterized protein n=1 Tax=Grifola frondosa TaxID=5627 RepID=A0A1C7M8I6_GRIFR|nr:hypothetical protein A0H81_07327 [Grifola frondosa]